MNANLNLNGYNPLAYVGVNPYAPSQFVVNTFSPTPNDYANFIIGAEWLNSDTLQVYKLVQKAGGVSKWVEFTAGTGTVITLTGNSGGSVPANPSGNINVVGDGTTIDVVGNPSTNTLTISAIGSGVLETLTGNSGGAVSPSAGNINVVGDGTTITVAGNPGTHTLTISAISSGVLETLTGNSGGAVSPSAGNINVVGDGTTVTIVGNPGTNTLTASVVGAAGWTSGTFTPALLFAGVSTGVTYSAQNGKYWKSGPMVFINIFIQLTSVGGLTGAVTMTGLPFTSANDNFDQVFTTIISGINPIVSGSGATPFQGYLPFNSTTMTFYDIAAGGGFPVSQLIALANNSSIQLSGFYWTS